MEALSKIRAVKSAKPSVAKTFAQSVLPNLREDGFRPFASKGYGRIVGETVQFLFLRVETRTKREFLLEFGCMLLAEPHEHFALTLGGKFPDGGAGKWYRARTDAVLAGSMGQVADAYLDAWKHWFERTSSLFGFIEAYEQLAQERPYLFRTGHPWFTLASAHAAQGNYQAARDACERALFQFEQMHQENPERVWAVRGREKCAVLAQALDSGSAAQLQRQWRAQSIATLKLESLEGISERSSHPEPGQTGPM